MKSKRTPFFIGRVFWKQKGRKVNPRAFSMPKSSPRLFGGKFTDYHGNVWPRCGSEPSTFRGPFMFQPPRITHE